MLTHRLCATMANFHKDVYSSGRHSPGKRSRMTRMFKAQIAAAALIAALVSGCEKTAPPAEAARPVRTVTIENGAQGEIVSLTGQVRAKDQVSLAFRLDGRMIERPVNVGDVLTADQVVARLDPQIQQNALRSAEANLASARRC